MNSDSLLRYTYFRKDRRSKLVLQIYPHISPQQFKYTLLGWMPTQQQWEYYERHIENLFTCSVAFRHICTCTLLYFGAKQSHWFICIDLDANLHAKSKCATASAYKIQFVYNAKSRTVSRAAVQRLWRFCSFVKRTRLNILRTIYILILKTTLKYLQGLKKNAGRQDISQKWFIVMKIPIQCL